MLESDEGDVDWGEGGTSGGEGGTSGGEGELASWCDGTWILNRPETPACGSSALAMT